MVDLEKWEKPWVNDFRGTNRSRPDLIERGLVSRQSVPETTSLATSVQQPGSVQRPSPQPPPKQEQRAEKLVAKQEHEEANAAQQQKKDALSNAIRIRQVLPYISQQQRGDIPGRLLLGWIDKESSGRLGLEMRNDLDEIGWFQISKEEREKYLGLRPDTRVKILSDPKFSAEQGIRLVRYYQRYLERVFGISNSSPARWELVKLIHKSGIGAVNHLLQNMIKSNSDPAASSWRDIKVFRAGQPQKQLSLEAMSRVDDVMFRGEVLEQYFGMSQMP